MLPLPHLPLTPTISFALSPPPPPSSIPPATERMGPCKPNTDNNGHAAATPRTPNDSFFFSFFVHPHTTPILILYCYQFSQKQKGETEHANHIYT